MHLCEGLASFHLTSVSSLEGDFAGYRGCLGCHQHNAEPMLRANHVTSIVSDGQETKILMGLPS